MVTQTIDNLNSGAKKKSGPSGLDMDFQMSVLGAGFSRKGGVSSTPSAEAILGWPKEGVVQVGTARVASAGVACSTGTGVWLGVLKALSLATMLINQILGSLAQAGGALASLAALAGAGGKGMRINLMV